MKTSGKFLNFKTLTALLIFNLVQIVLWAQDNPGSSTTTSTKKVGVSVENSSNWYASPWVWVVGAAVFILLLVALLRGSSSSGSSDTVRVTKTVERDTDV